ncbi:unnamed protein product [Mytilus edulis]|uniref:Direct IAP-binding protein with low pI n=1 Tax=Mytilus edulis TaxID=6550 RepID=A0A8S3U040_MYTED|nr:unnamed protein product [Mytilus edulis]
MLYGLETLLPNGKNLDLINKQYKKMLKQILSLTTNVADPAVYIISGQLPAEAEIHKRAFTLSSCQTTDNITAPDPSTLLSETLVRNASFAVVESTTAFLSQVTVSLVESCEQYTKALYILMKLMDYRLKVLGNGESEQKIADLIIEARASVNKLKSRNQELQLLYMSAYNLVNEASTAAYTAGSEFHSTVATSMVQSSEVHLSKFQRDLKDAEAELREMEANVIRVESEYMEKKIQAQDDNSDVENKDFLNIETQNIETNSEDNFQHDGLFDAERNENES